MVLREESPLLLDFYMALESSDNYRDEICLSRTDGAALVGETLALKVLGHSAADLWALPPAHPTAVLFHAYLVYWGAQQSLHKTPSVGDAGT